MKLYNHFVDCNKKNWENIALSELKDKGLCVLRGVDSDKNLNLINRKVSSVLENPSILGSVGYYQKEPHKILYDGFLLGKEVINLISNKYLINIIEEYVEDEIILNEIFLKYDLGTDLVYFPYHRHTGADIEGPVDKPFGCGCMVYLHDTDAGAFCYSIYSHKYPIYKNAESLLSKHDHKNKLEENLHKVVGKKGDLVIFDERGFHGPEQPTKASRKVLLFGYQSKKSTLNRSRTGIPVIISDLKDLSQKQLSSIGFGGSTRNEYNEYHIRKSAKKTSVYKLSSFLIKNLFYYEKSFIKTKKIIKSFLDR